MQSHRGVADRVLLGRADAQECHEQWQLYTRLRTRPCISGFRRYTQVQTPFQLMCHMNFFELANFIWSLADLLRGDYKQADYGKIILPFTLLLRLECVLEPTKADVLAEYAKRKDTGDNLDIFLPRESKQEFYNVTGQFNVKQFKVAA